MAVNRTEVTASSKGPGTLSTPQQKVSPAASSLPPLLLFLLAGLLVPGALAYALAATNETRVVAVVLALLGVLAIVARPFWGLILFVGLLYVRPEEVLPALQGMRFTLIVSAVTLLSLVIQRLLNREAAVKHPLSGMIVGFGLMAVLSTLNLGNTLAAALDVAKLVVLVLLVLNLVRTPERYRAFVTALLVFTGYLAAYSVYLYFTGSALQQEGLQRSLATGIFSDPNDLAATMVAGLALALARVKRAGGIARLLYLFTAAFMVWAILLTNSRGGMLALLVVLGGFFLCFTRRKVLAVVLAALVTFVFLTFGPSRMSTFDSTEQSANSRFWFWENGIDQVIAHPLTGVGYGQFPTVNGGITAHNSFVLCFAELGFLGYFFWMGCMYYCFRGRPDQEGAFWAPGEGAREGSDAAGDDLLAARLALAAFLVASFWLSHTYVPVLYLLIGLPAAQQIAASAGRPNRDAGVTPGARLPLKAASWGQDWVRIALICMGSILFIKLLADHYK